VDPDGPGSAGQRAPVVEVARAVPLPGVVVEQLPSSLYRVRLDEGSLVMAHVADRIDRNFVRVLVGDRVHVELSPSDAGRGRIVEKI
jgi:translation initiation factor IF-1